MVRTIKPSRKVKGSITGEVFETTTPEGKIPRRKLPDGRTETGKAISLGAPETSPLYAAPDKGPETPVFISGDIDLAVDGDDGLNWEKGGPIKVEIPSGDIPPDPPLTEKQPPKTTKKDLNKMEDLFFAFGCALDNEKYDGAQKAAIIGNLFADTTDVRVETAQFVMSAKMYGVLSAIASTLLMVKDMTPGGLFAGYRRAVKGMAGRKSKVPDVFGEE